MGNHILESHRLKIADCALMLAVDGESLKKVAVIDLKFLLESPTVETYRCNNTASFKNAMFVIRGKIASAK